MLLEPSSIRSLLRIWYRWRATARPSAWRIPVRSCRRLLGRIFHDAALFPLFATVRRDGVCECVLLKSNVDVYNRVSNGALCSKFSLYKSTGYHV